MQPHPEVLYWGLRFSDWLNVLGLLLGPIFGVLITLWVDARRRTREPKLTILRLLLTTRHLVGDPSYSAAINLIPIEFAGNTTIQNAYREFIASASADVTEETKRKAAERTAVKQTKLIYAIARSMGYNIAETDIQTSAYASEGWIERDNTLVESQKAMIRVANALWLQLKVTLGYELTDIEKRAANIPTQRSEESK